jgi:hypothetical protein
MKITILTKLTRCMKKKKHIDEIDQMMKLGWKLLLYMFMDICW